MAGNHGAGKAMTIDYKINATVSIDQFIDVLNQSTLGERRPLNDRDCLAGMLANSNLVATAWSENQLVGIARAMTDFHYACYLSDLAVNRSYQKQGIGKNLITLIRQQLKTRCKLILVSAPAAMDYYRLLGFEHNDRCWILHPEKILE